MTDEDCVDPEQIAVLSSLDLNRVSLLAEEADERGLPYAPASFPVRTGLPGDIRQPGAVDEQGRATAR